MFMMLPFPIPTLDLHETNVYVFFLANLKKLCLMI